MKSWIAAVLLPSVALAAPKLQAKRYYNSTEPYATAHYYPTGYATGSHPKPSGVWGTGIGTGTYPTSTAVLDPSHPPKHTYTYSAPPSTPERPVPTTTGTPSATGACYYPGKYECTYANGQWGWAVCDTTYTWVHAGDCAAAETCAYNPLSGSPYCVPAAKPADEPHGESTPGPTAEKKECYPDSYQCAHSAARGWYIQQCDAAGRWADATDCEASETCTYSPVHGYPYCKAKETAAVCSPGAYECYFSTESNAWGWRTCSVEGAWVFSGLCGAGQTCSMNTLNGSPYCT